MSIALLLFMWIMTLTMIAWFLTLFLGLLTQFDSLDISLLVESFKEFSIGGVLLFILSTPIILVTLVMKNYVPTIIFTVVITLINVMGGSSEHRALFPWAAAGDIANHTLPSTYPPEYSYTAIIVTALTGLIALIVYFKKADIYSFCHARIVRDCRIKDTRDLSCILFILSCFVRYTRKPKDNKNFILAESGFRLARQNGHNKNWQGFKGGDFLSDLLKY